MVKKKKWGEASHEVRKEIPRCLKKAGIPLKRCDLLILIEKELPHLRSDNNKFRTGLMDGVLYRDKYGGSPIRNLNQSELNEVTYYSYCEEKDLS